MIAAGIDLGGTKIETQLFDADWRVCNTRRVDTPKTYDALVDAMVAQIRWAEDAAGQPLAVGVGAAGLVNPITGHAFTANLPASGHPFPTDISSAVGHAVTYVNDCRALTLSEAIFGVGQGYKTVMGVIMGTGIGGGLSVDGALLTGPTQTGGEYGHASAPAHLVAAHDLPIVQCGCGRMGCVETLIAGPGLSRIAERIMGRPIAPPDLVPLRSKDAAAQKVWDIWCAITADALLSLTLTVDPDCIVLGGGLSKIAGVADDLSAAMQNTQISGFSVPPVLLAQGGDTSGARGAAYAAYQAEEGT